MSATYSLGHSTAARLRQALRHRPHLLPLACLMRLQDGDGTETDARQAAGALDLLGEHRAADELRGMRVAS